MQAAHLQHGLRDHLHGVQEGGEGHVLRLPGGLLPEVHAHEEGQALRRQPVQGDALPVRQLQGVGLVAHHLLHLPFLVIVAAVAPNEPLGGEVEAQGNKPRSGKPGGNAVDGLRPGLLPALHVEGRLLDADHEADRAVLHAPGQDVGRGLPEGQDALHSQGDALADLVVPRADGPPQLAECLGESVGVPVGGLLGLPNGIGPGLLHTLPLADLLRRDAPGLAVLRHGIGVVRLGEPDVLGVQRRSVALPGRFQRLQPEDGPPLLHILVGVGEITVLPAAQGRLLHLGIVAPGCAQQRPIPLGGSHHRLAPLQLPAGDPVDRLLNGGGRQILHGHHRGETGVAHHIPHVGPGIPQHGEIPPGVPLVPEAGGHLPPDVPVDVPQGGVPCLLVLGPEEALRQLLVDLQLRPLAVPEPLVDLLLQVLNAPLYPVKLRLRGELLQDAGGLKRLGGAPLVGHHVLQDAESRFGVAGIGGVVVEGPAHGRVGLGDLALPHALRPVRQCLPPAHLRDLPGGVGDGFLIRVGVIAEGPLRRQFLNAGHHLIRRGLGLQNGPHRLGELPSVPGLPGHGDGPGRRLPLRDGAVLPHILVQNITVAA